MGLADPLKTVILTMLSNIHPILVRSFSTALIPFGSFRIRGDRKLPLFNPSRLFIMSPNFAEFLLENAETGNEILAVLDDIVEVVETGGTDL